MLARFIMWLVLIFASLMLALTGWAVYGWLGLVGALAVSGLLTFWLGGKEMVS